MAYEVQGIRVSAIAGTEISQFSPVTISSANTVVPSQDNDLVYGVCQNDPRQGEAAEIMIYGITKVVAAGVINPGEQVAPAGNGKVKKADTTQGDIPFGVALEGAAADGVVITIKLF